MEICGGPTWTLNDITSSPVRARPTCVTTRSDFGVRFRKGDRQLVMRPSAPGLHRGVHLIAAGPCLCRLRRGQYPDWRLAMGLTTKSKLYSGLIRLTK